MKTLEISEVTLKDINLADGLFFVEYFWNNPELSVAKDPRPLEDVI